MCVHKEVCIQVLQQQRSMQSRVKITFVILCKCLGPVCLDTVSINETLMKTLLKGIIVTHKIPEGDILRKCIRNIKSPIKKRDATQHRPIKPSYRNQSIVHFLCLELCVPENYTGSINRKLVY